MLVRPKDYISSEQGLFFAVVSDNLEDNRALTFLRYVKHYDRLKKLETGEAGQLIKTRYPEFLFHSNKADSELHGIPVEEIYHLYRPEETVARLLSTDDADHKQQEAVNMVKLLIESGVKQDCIGITGSIMLGTHHEQSDLDLVLYGRDNFFKARSVIKDKISTGDIKPLNDSMWFKTWVRRGCELDYNTYLLHERKKYNKCMSGSSKVDISMIPNQVESPPAQGTYKKTGRAVLNSTVINDIYAYDFPARYIVDDSEINEVVCFTSTYAGQAANNDQIEAAGVIERNELGDKRLVVGTSREATGEYIKVTGKNKAQS